MVDTEKVGVEAAAGKAATAATDPKPSRAAWLVLFTVLTASIMDLLDATITNVAAPSIRNSFSASSSALQWIIAGYTLSFSVMLIAGGRLGDVYGRRRMFLTGLGGFVVASALCSASQSAGMLIGTRVVQGAFAAVMIPQGIGLIRAAFPPQKVGSAFAMFGPFMGLSAMLGPIIGGVLVDSAGWRSIFLINVPVGAIALVGALRVLPNDAHHEGRRPTLDLLGMALATAAVLMLVYPMIQGREAGWPVWTFLMMAGSAPVLGVFALHQRARHRAGRDPFIEPGLFRKRSFVTGLMTIMLFFGACSGVFLIGTLLLQGQLHFSPTHAGLTMVSWSLGTVVSMAVSQGIAQRMPRRVLQTGLLVLGAGLAFSAVTVHHYAGHHGHGLTSFTFAPALFVSGLGMGLIFAPFFGIVLAAVEDHEVGSASGLVNSFDQLGGAIGVAALGTVFFNRVQTSHGDMFSAAELVYWIAAGVLAAVWVLAFLVPRTARPEDELYG
jgi:EmrB/QacA subfamily drug resistance transporter